MNIHIIPATNYQTSFDGESVHHLGRVYRVISTRQIGDRGIQVCARADGDQFDRYFFVDSTGQVRS